MGISAFSSFYYTVTSESESESEVIIVSSGRCLAATAEPGAVPRPAQGRSSKDLFDSAGVA